VNSAVRRSLVDDAGDLVASGERAAEPTVPYGGLVTATELRFHAVEDGIAWLRQVAEEPSADSRPSLEILREVRTDAGGVEQGTDAPSDAGSGV